MNETLALTLFSEIVAIDHSVRGILAKALPKGMEMSHFVVLNHLGGLSSERTPAQLADSFKVTRGAMSNTITKLETKGFVHVRPDWDDARRKLVVISPAGRRAREEALSLIEPLFSKSVSGVGPDELKAVLPVLRALRIALATSAASNS